MFRPLLIILSFFAFETIADCSASRPFDWKLKPGAGCPRVKEAEDCRGYATWIFKGKCLGDCEREDLGIRPKTQKCRFRNGSCKSDPPRPPSKNVCVEVDPDEPQPPPSEECRDVEPYGENGCEVTTPSLESCCAKRCPDHKRPVCLPGTEYADARCFCMRRRTRPGGESQPDLEFLQDYDHQNSGSF